ncbi:hypothetical protein [Aggregatibacter kilianii]|uniref:hypothetical protein n=1 Tax=Aggregatibacter kilianii TaxID=2025884 RepID=UPI000D6460C6|nr:hypothetical protein [Aggregatibacter kilianii]
MWEILTLLFGVVVVLFIVGLALSCCLIGALFIKSLRVLKAEKEEIKMQEMHLIEITQQYQLGVIDGCFVVYRLKEAERYQIKQSTSFEEILSFICSIELQDERVATIEDVLIRHKAICDEVQGAKQKAQALDE